MKKPDLHLNTPITEKERQDIRRSIRRATNTMSYEKQRVANWIEESVLKGKPIDVRSGAQRLKVSFSEFYELVGRVMDIISTECSRVDLE